MSIFLDKEQTATALIQLALDCNVPLSKLSTFIDGIIDISYVNSHFSQGTFRAKNMVDSFNTISNMIE